MMYDLNEDDYLLSHNIWESKETKEFKNYLKRQRKYYTHYIIVTPDKNN